MDPSVTPDRGLLPPPPPQPSASVAVDDDGNLARVSVAGGETVEVASSLCDALGDLIGSRLSVISARVATIVDDRIGFASLSERRGPQLHLLAGVATARDAREAVRDAVLRAVFGNAGSNVLRAGAARFVHDSDVRAAVITSALGPARLGPPDDVHRLEHLAALVPAGGRLTVSTVRQPYRVLSTGNAAIALALADRAGAIARVDQWLDAIHDAHRQHLNRA